MCSSVQVYKQRVKHMMYEHQNSIAVLKSDAELGLKQAEEAAAGREEQLLADQRALQQQLREQAGPSSNILLIEKWQANKRQISGTHRTFSGCCGVRNHPPESPTETPASA